MGTVKSYISPLVILDLDEHPLSCLLISILTREHCSDRTPDLKEPAGFI